MNLSDYLETIKKTSEYLEQYKQGPTPWCIILGSGLGGFSSFTGKIIHKILYSDIPGFPPPTISGHQGILYLCKIRNFTCFVMEGRLHLYEGYTPQKVVFPVRVMMNLGVRHFFITNAAGGLSSHLQIGDLMLITDHINLMGTNPLIGPNIESFGPRFPAMRNCYDPVLRNMVSTLADSMKLNLKSGVYAALTGPAYETEAEVKMLKILGADAVGMSTVPEVIAIRHGGAKVIGISLITNMATCSELPSHKEVLDMGLKRREELHQLIYSLISSNGSNLWKK